MKQRVAMRGWLFEATLLLVVGVITIATPLVSWAQGASIEELEQRLQKAKDDKAQRDAAAAAAAAKSRAGSDAARARSATLVVQTDAACTLSVNGKKMAQLESGGITEVPVPPGQSLVRCLSVEENIVVEEQVEARSGQNSVLRITLAQHVEEIRRSKRRAEEKALRERREVEEKAQRELREAEERVQLQQREAEARARAQAEQKAAVDAAAKRFQTVSGDVLYDAQASVQWTRADNGRNVNLSEAQVHCAGLGSDWSLPTLAQLRSLYDKRLPGIRCLGSSCKVSDLFRLSGVWFWSSEASGSSFARYFDLVDGLGPLADVRSFNGRALCVRRP